MSRPVATPEYEGVDRRQNGSSPIGDLPWWVRAIAIIGIPGAIAVFLVYIGATEVPKIKSEIIATRTQVEENQRLLAAQAEQNAAIYRMLVRVCSNTSKTENDRQRCFER